MKKFTVFLIMLAFLALPAAVFAQQVQEEAEEAGQAAEQAAEETGEAAQEGAEEAGQAADQAAEQAQQPAGEQVLIRFDNLVGTVIASQAGDVEGTIQDAVLTSQGELTHVVVELAQAEAEAQPQEAPPAEQDQTGAAQPQDQAQPGVAQAPPAPERYLIPADRVTFGQPNQAAMLDISAQEFEQQPTLQEGQLPAEIAGEAGQAQVMYVLGSELQNYTFIGQNGDEIGGVEGIMLDLQQKQVVYIALATGGFLGLGEKLLALPMDVIAEWNLEDERLLTSLTNEQLDQAEGFDGESWPDQPQQFQAAGPQEQQQ